MGYMPMQEAVVVDLDGTVADNKHRTRYLPKGKLDWAILLDPDRIKDDAFVEECRPFLEGLGKRGIKLVFLSGRVAEQRNATERWLQSHGLEHDELILRGPNQRFAKDAVFKRTRLVSLQRRFKIVLFIDNELAVVEMARELDLPAVHLQSFHQWNEMSLKMDESL